MPRRSVPVARTLIAALSFMGGARIAAQAPPQRYATRDWIIDRWSADQGLPQNTIMDIAQTGDGYFWIATYGGLVRFDGVRFTTFSTHAYPALGSDRVMALAVGRDGAMWIGTDRGLVRLKDGVFREWTEADGRPAGQSTGLFPDRDGSVWLTTSVGGLARFANGVFERFGDRGVPNSYAEGVAIDGAGAVWLSLGGSRFTVRRPGASRFTPVQLGSGALAAKFFSIIDKNGAAWFQTARGPARWTGTSLVPLWTAGKGDRLTEDTRGGYWLLGVERMIHLDSARRVEVVPGPPLSGFDQIRRVFVDRQGTLWLGTNTMGLLRVSRRVFRMYLKEDGLENEPVAALMRDRRGRLWVGSSCGPTSMIIGTTLRVERSLPGCIFSLGESPTGGVWIGGYGGVGYMTPDGRTTRLPPDSLPSPEVLAIYAERDSTVWLGSQNGLVHVVPGKFVRYSTADGLPSNEIHFVTRDRKGALWVGTVSGLARLEGNRFRAWTTRDGLPHNSVRAVYQDADGIWWIGTYGGGLARFDGKRFVAISSRDGLYDDIVSTILEDAAGNLWMSGNRGVFRASRRDLNAFANGQTSLVPSPGYGPSDGLLTVETNGGFEPSAWQDADGRLWYATVRGLATVDPKAAIGAATTPSVAIEGARVDGRAVSVAKGLDLPSGSRSFEIDYTGLSSPSPQRLVFRYRLENLDDTWQYVNGRRTAYFTGVGPGRYAFVVSAANPDGQWDAQGERLSIVIHAPWWATLWFRGLAAVAIVAIVAAAVRQRIARLHERARVQREYARHLLAGQESERRRLAGELHDSLSQDLLVMKSRATLALRAVDPGHAARPHIEEVVEVATQAARNAREISHGLRPHQLDHLGLSAAVRDLAHRAGAAGAAGTPTVTVEADGDIDGAVGVEEATHVYRILQEALNNVIKHAAATQVVIRLSAAPDRLRVSVSDNGCGVDLAADGFGLTGIRQRVRLLNGRVEMRSAPGQGMTISMELPRALTPSKHAAPVALG